MHVIPAQAGIHNHMKTLDPRLRGDDRQRTSSIFYDAVTFARAKQQAIGYGRWAGQDYKEVAIDV
jgi:hypothetical protein